MSMLDEKNKSCNDNLAKTISLIGITLIVFVIVIHFLLLIARTDSDVHDLEMKVIALEIRVEQYDPVIQFFNENKTYLLPAQSEPVKEK